MVLVYDGMKKPLANKVYKWLLIAGDPGGIRTHDPQLRRLSLQST